MKKFFNVLASSVLGIFLCPLMVQADQGETVDDTAMIGR